MVRLPGQDLSMEAIVKGKLSNNCQFLVTMIDRICQKSSVATSEETGEYRIKQGWEFERVNQNQA